MYVLAQIWQSAWSINFQLTQIFHRFSCFCFFLVDISPLSRVRFTFLYFRCRNDFFCRFFARFSAASCRCEFTLWRFFQFADLQSMCSYTHMQSYVCVRASKCCKLALGCGSLLACLCAAARPLCQSTLCCNICFVQRFRFSFHFRLLQKRKNAYFIMSTHNGEAEKQRKA